MFRPAIGFGTGFAAPGLLTEAKKTQTSVIGGKKIKEKKGKLTKDLGKPAMKASSKDLKAYVDKAKGPEKAKRVARVNLMKAHKKGHKAQGHALKSESVLHATPTMKAMPIMAVVQPKFNFRLAPPKKAR